jgi:tetratricopeptide (TPR) repeat protein
MIEGRPAEGLALLNRERQAHPFSAIDELDRPYLTYGYAYALGGELGRARSMLAEYEQIPAELRRENEPYRLSLSAIIASAEGQQDRALDLLDRIPDNVECSSCFLAERGLVHDRAGRPDSAIADYQRFVDSRDLTRAFSDVYYLPVTLRRLGQLYEEKGDREKALEFYGRFVELWKGADPALQPKVAEVRNRMSALTAEP